MAIHFDESASIHCIRTQGDVERRTLIEIQVKNNQESWHAIYL